LLAGSAPAWADDVVLDPASFDCLGSGCSQSSRHDDADPFKGSITLNATNTGDEAWGDFHFEFFQIPGGDPIENVDWVVGDPYQPTMNGSSTGLTWDPNNAVTGATLDLFFYGNPVDPGESVTFVVYSDNTTDNVPFFGTLYYPTPVPEPGTLLLFGVGALGLGLYGRRARKF
jgi:hypothetical protein